MRRLLLALVLIPLTAPVYAERNCTDHFAEDAHSTWDDCIGTYTHANGNVYEGDFRESQRNGKGRMTWTAEEKAYEGDWKDGKRHGKGKLIWLIGVSGPDLVRQEGIWVDDEYSESARTKNSLADS